MRKLKVIWTSDVCECETCGASYADGFKAYLDDELIDEFVPHAACYDGDNIDRDDVWMRLFKHFGVEVETDYE